jgi:hypothetical protein
VGRPKKELSAADKRALRQIYSDIERADAAARNARDRLAAFAATRGQRAIADELGLSQQAISSLIASRKPKPKKK